MAVACNGRATGSRTVKVRKKLVTDILSWKQQYIVVQKTMHTVMC